MTTPLRLVIFDVDGTLVDSRVHILCAMRQAFESFDLLPPADGDILHGVGLSLPELMAILHPIDQRQTELPDRQWLETAMARFPDFQTHKSTQ